MYIIKLLIIIAIMVALRWFIQQEDETTETTEGFWGYSPRYCPNCGDMGPRACMRCHNCGWAVSTSGHAQCLPGGPKGPLFSSNTVSWRYGGGRVPFRRRHIPYNPYRYHNPWWHFW